MAEAAGEDGLRQHRAGVSATLRDTSHKGSTGEAPPAAVDGAGQANSPAVPTLTRSRRLRVELRLFSDPPTTPPPHTHTLPSSDAHADKMFSWFSSKVASKKIEEQRDFNWDTLSRFCFGCAALFAVPPFKCRQPKTIWVLWGSVIWMQSLSLHSISDVLQSISGFFNCAGKLQRFQALNL